jgi:ubiquitin-conjugating enzyme E2 variant
MSVMHRLCLIIALVAPASALRCSAPAASRRTAPLLRAASLDYTRPPPELTLPGDTLDQRPAHVAYVAAATAATAGVVVDAAHHLGSPAATAAAAAAGLLGAELFSGVFHWATDNYGSLETPVVGAACAAFQGHHLAPWTITYREPCNNVYKIARAATPFVVLSALAPPAAALALALTFYGQTVAQECHKWAHVPPSAQPRAVRLLQRSGLALSVKEHGKHHKSPYGAHYCILSGALNPLLDASGFFRALEKFFYDRTGVEPNCWNELPYGPAVRARALGLAEPALVVEAPLADAPPSVLEPYLAAPPPAGAEDEVLVEA